MAESCCVSLLNVEEFAQYLEDNGYEDTIVTNFRENQISGAAFLKLKENHLKELIPVIGVRLSISELLERVKQDSGEVGVGNGDTPSSGTKTVEKRPPLKTKDMNATDTQSEKPKENPKWHHTFSIPNREVFSGWVQKAVDTGVVSARARKDIVQMVRALMLQHTKYPTSDQYNTVCEMLVKKFPKLKDTLGSGYGSWKESLRNSFKNYRRDHSEDCSSPRPKRSDTKSCPQPPSKRLKLDGSIKETGISEDEYTQAVADLKQEYSKSKKSRNQAEIKRLMDITLAKRRQWITSDSPLVAEIMKKFPPLKSTKALRRELRELLEIEGRTTALMDSWPEWERKLIEFSKVESSSRPAVRDVLSQLERSEDDISYPSDWRCVLVLNLLIKILFPRGTSKGALFIKNFESCDVDLEEEAKKIKQAAPYIIITGEAGSETAQYYISCESKVVIESKSAKDALVDLIATYYVFDIAYPSALAPIYIFIQHFVWGVKDGQVVPTSTNKLISNLVKFV